MNRTLLLTALGLALAACDSKPTPVAQQVPAFYVSMAKPGAVVDSATARDMIGAYRRNNNLPPLALDPGLQALAEAESDAMAAADKPASADAVKARLAGAGYRTPGANLSAGYHTLAEAFSGWRESPQHNRVLLDPKATRMAIATAYAPNSKYKVYWTLVVASDGR
ncbi:CAP domain-containing protein [Microvirga pudoricolor]|uniref:CAP domain-containing protein n=1 Tax=Microvirga pudoricolor TaxID=2778729 RepID=UPI00389912C6